MLDRKNPTVYNSFTIIAHKSLYSYASECFSAARSKPKAANPHIGSPYHTAQWCLVVSIVISAAASQQEGSRFDFHRDPGSLCS